MAFGGGWGGGVGAGPPGAAGGRAALRGDPLGAAGRGRPAPGRRTGTGRARQRLHASRPSAGEGEQLTLWRLLVRYPRMLVTSGVLIVDAERGPPGRPQADRDRHQQRPVGGPEPEDVRGEGLPLQRRGVGGHRLSGVHHDRGPLPAVSGQGDGPAGGRGHERPPGQDLHPPAATVARLLHGREGRA